MPEAATFHATLRVKRRESERVLYHPGREDLVTEVCVCARARARACVCVTVCVWRGGSLSLLWDGWVTHTPCENPHMDTRVACVCVQARGLVTAREPRWSWEDPRFYDQLGANDLNTSDDVPRALATYDCDGHVVLTAVLRDWE